MFCRIFFFTLMLLTTSPSGYSMETSTPVKRPAGTPNVSPSSGEERESVENTKRQRTSDSTYKPYSSSMDPEEKAHRSWFSLFTLVMDYAQSKKELNEVLQEGNNKGYLNKFIVGRGNAITPLRYAAESGDLEMVKLLIEDFQVDVQAIQQKDSQKNPLYAAALQGCTSVVEYLLSLREKDPNADFEEVLQAVLQHGMQGHGGLANLYLTKRLKKSYEDRFEELFKGEILLELAKEGTNPYTISYARSLCTKKEA